MACSKCGSDWTTKTGKDCASCPHCCKQQRTKARKQGRWSDACNGLRNCEVCSSEFSASSSRQKCCSVACRQSLRKMWLAKWKPEYSKDYSGGRLRGTQKPKRKSPVCRMCGGTFTRKGPKQYCSRKCFAEARKCGVQSWDRTNQLEAVYHRGGRWKNAPSKAYVAAVGRIDAWLAKASGLCSAMLKANAEDIAACVDCERACVSCGGSLPTFHRGRKQCNACRRSKKRKLARERRRLFGNHRRRCRSYGVPFDRTITAVAVFARDGLRCQCCGRVCLNEFRMIDGVPDRRSPTIGHIVALCRKLKGHTWDNVQCECWGCNIKKGARSEGQHRLMV